MNIDYNIISIFDFFALLQGVIFGSILIFSSQRNRPSLFLGLFLITFSIELVDSILADTGILSQYPQLLFTPLNFYFLSLPLLYLYSKKLINSTLKRRDLLIFIPGIVEFLVFSVLFLLPVEQKLKIQETLIFDRLFIIYFFLGLIYSMSILILVIRLVTKHQKEILNYYSNTGNHSILWVKRIAISFFIYNVCLILYFIGIHLYFDAEPKLGYALVSIVNTIFIYWVAISGLRQTNAAIPSEPLPIPVQTTPIPAEQNLAIPKPVKKEVFIQNKIPDEVQIGLLDSLQRLIEKEQLYKNSKLTLPILAKHFLVSRQELSRIINKDAGINFNRFINEYRVKEAKRLLEDASYDNLNMFGIAEKVGFSSKATFFATFKRITGTSPGQYKKQSRKGV